MPRLNVEEECLENISELLCIVPFGTDTLHRIWRQGLADDPLDKSEFEGLTLDIHRYGKLYMWKPKGEVPYLSRLTYVIDVRHTKEKPYIIYNRFGQTVKLYEMTVQQVYDLFDVGEAEPVRAIL